MGAVYVIFAGVNGVGKSTLYGMDYEGKFPKERVNSDEILREFNGDWRNLRDQAVAMKESVKRIKYNFDNKISFNQETTLTGNSIINNIKLAKKLGYTVEMYYIGVKNVETAIKRVKYRERTGGHGIDEADIRRRYVQSLENLTKVIPVCDRVEIFDNTYEFKRVAVFVGRKCVKRSRNCKWLNNILAQSLLRGEIER